MDCRECVKENQSGQSCRNCSSVGKDGLCKDKGYHFSHKAAAVEIWGCVKYKKKKGR